MCGISGILSLSGSAIDPGLLKKMIDSILHRGPDDNGFFTDQNVGLGHARLSIIDLAGGRQPMHTEDGRYTITFNGEIFNYIELRKELIDQGVKFKSKSDTEVILHLFRRYGDQCVQKLNGQWAFAIWDKHKAELFLSRDRLGIRPLFYTIQNNYFVFASEIKSIFSIEWVERNISATALAQIFTIWHPLPPNTIYNKIFQLEPGHSLLVSAAQPTPTPKKYWGLNYLEPFNFADEDEAADHLRSLLTNATHIRLRSDVPVGAYLSGGLDSSVTSGIIRFTTNNNLETFSVTFQDAEFDESNFQKEVADFLGTKHHSIRCGYNDICRVFPDVIWHTEQPIVRTAPAPLFILSNLVRNSGYKVVLTGEGADEIFGGYDIFKEAKIRMFWGRQPESRFRPLLLKKLYPYMSKIQNQSLEYLKAFFHAKPQDMSHPLFSHIPRWELGGKNTLFFSKDFKSLIKGLSILDDVEKILPTEYLNWDPFSKAQYLETSLLLPGYILSSQGDRMAMAHSVEGRFPFLDYRVVEFGARLPPHLKMKGLNEKYLLKKATQKFVPPSITQRTKQPYRSPDSHSFLSKDGKLAPGYVSELLSQQSIKDSGIFNPLAVSSLIEKAKSNKITSVKDNMAFVGILSTQLIVEQFIKNTGRIS